MPTGKTKPVGKPTKRAAPRSKAAVTPLKRRTFKRSAASQRAVARPKPARDAELTAREVEVLQKVAGGNRSRDIADMLFISEQTVKVHIRHILDKLRAKNRTQAFAIAVRRGIIEL